MRSSTDLGGLGRALMISYDPPQQGEALRLGAAPQPPRRSRSRNGDRRVAHVALPRCAGAPDSPSASVAARPVVRPLRSPPSGVGVGVLAGAGAE